MSKIVKGIKKISKKITKGVKKAFKKVASSFIGKIILAAIVIYTGGVLMGAWGATGPMSGMFGAWGGAGATAASTVGTTAAETAVAAGTGAAQTTAGTVLSTAAPQAVAGLSTAAETAAVLEGAGAASSGLAGYAKGALAFMEANPLATSMAMKGVATALSPDQEDIMREQEKQRRERFARLSGVGNVDIGMQSSGTPLRSISGTPWHERLKGAG